MASIKIAAGQLCSSSNLSQNLRVVKKLLQRAHNSQSRILFLPEATDYISRNANHSIELALQVHDQFLSPLLEYIKSLNGSTYLSIGIHLPGAKRVKNLHLLIDPKGNIISQYQKVHLFDVDVPNGPILKELNSVEPGNEIEEPVMIDNFKIGLGICYDIRFPELALRLRKLGSDIITFPSAFTTRTGEAHWELLSKSRAIDSQCYVVNAAQCGKHEVGKDPNDESKVVTRISYGDTIIVDSWGEILARGRKYTDELPKDDEGDYYELIYADLDKDKLDKVRTNMPLLEHRRPDVFGYEI